MVARWRGADGCPSAAEAIAAAGRDAGRIKVQEADAANRIAIRDNGEGFDPAQGPDLFQRGVSTRAYKSGGRACTGAPTG